MSCHCAVTFVVTAMSSSVLQANTCTIETLSSIEDQVSRFEIDQCNDWTTEDWSAFGVMVGEIRGSISYNNNLAKTVKAPKYVVTQEEFDKKFPPLVWVRDITQGAQVEVSNPSFATLTGAFDPDVPLDTPIILREVAQTPAGLYLSKEVIFVSACSAEDGSTGIVVEEMFKKNPYASCHLGIEPVLEDFLQLKDLQCARIACIEKIADLSKVAICSR